jgi:hypothetical protein
MRRLQQIFDTPPTYGRLLDMKGDYQVVDVARVLRKYLEDLPVSIKPWSSACPSQAHFTRRYRSR